MSSSPSHPSLARHASIVNDIDQRRKARHDELLRHGFPQQATSRPSPHHYAQRLTSPNDGQYRNHLSSDNAARGSPRPPESRRSSRSQERVPESAEQTEARQRKKQAFGEIYSADEETLRNDLGMAYLTSGRRAQNFLKGCELEQRFDEYPKLAKLLSVHKSLVEANACPPTYLSKDLRKFHLPTLLPVKFDCIVIDPPLREYAQAYPGRFQPSPYHDDPHSESLSSLWTWEELAALPIPQIASNPGFIWLWVGSGKADENGVSGLDKGRELLAQWGYRRCEDIVWLKTNKRKPGLENEPPTNTLLTHTKEHCLMGIRGTVRRSTDGHFAHCNIDTDVIVWEPDAKDPLRKPPELYTLIENFCMGTRRLELFGMAKNTRRGWLTIGADSMPAEASDSTNDTAATQPYDKAVFDAYFAEELASKSTNLVPTTTEVDALRPRSPGGPHRASTAASVSVGSGIKSNPQGIGRHSNRAATPSASQQLEFERLQQQFQQSVYMRTQMEMQERQRMEMMQQQQIMMAQQQQQQAMMLAAMGLGANMPMGMGQVPMQMSMGMGFPGMPDQFGMGMTMGMNGMSNVPMISPNMDAFGNQALQPLQPLGFASPPQQVNQQFQGVSGSNMQHAPHNQYGQQ